MKFPNDLERKWSQCYEIKRSQEYIELFAVVLVPCEGFGDHDYMGLTQARPNQPAVSEPDHLRGESLVPS